MSKLQPQLDNVMTGFYRTFSSNFADEIDNGQFKCVCGSCETKVSEVEYDFETQRIVLGFPFCVYSQIIMKSFFSEKSKDEWRWILDLYYEDRREYEDDLENLVDEDTQELLQNIDPISILEV